MSSDRGRDHAVEHFGHADCAAKCGAIGEAGGLEALDQSDAAASLGSGACKRELTVEHLRPQRFVAALQNDSCGVDEGDADAGDRFGPGGDAVGAFSRGRR